VVDQLHAGPVVVVEGGDRTSISPFKLKHLSGVDFFKFFLVS
jgi:hypothetical protein